MEIIGTYKFAAPPARVWELLMDPTVIASCVPGCEELAPEGEDRYRAKMKVAMAAITGNYEGTIIINHKVPPQSYKLTVEGQGRPGFVKGAATIALRPEGAGTIVDVTGDVETGGMVARLGQRLISGVAKMMQDRFFACLQSKIGGG
jgi:carbon monoxide dehydrogenase subunit G